MSSLPFSQGFVSGKRHIRSNKLAELSSIHIIIIIVLLLRNGLTFSSLLFFSGKQYLRDLRLKVYLLFVCLQYLDYLSFEHY